MPHRSPLRLLVVGPSHALLSARLGGDCRVELVASVDPDEAMVIGADVSPDRLLGGPGASVDALLVEYRGSPEDDAGLLEELRAAHPSAILLFVVDSCDPHRVAEVVRLGGDAIVPLEGLDVSVVLGAAARVDGTVVLPRAAALGLAQAWPPPTQLLLSDREREVLACLDARMTNVQIASELFISRETVKTHVANLLRKLRADDRHSVVDRARRIGLI